MERTKEIHILLRKKNKIIENLHSPLSKINKIGEDLKLNINRNKLVVLSNNLRDIQYDNLATHKNPDAEVFIQIRNNLFKRKYKK